MFNKKLYQPVVKIQPILGYNVMWFLVYTFRRSTQSDWNMFNINTQQTFEGFNNINVFILLVPAKAQCVS